MARKKVLFLPPLSWVEKCMLLSLRGEDGRGAVWGGQGLAAVLREAFQSTIEDRISSATDSHPHTPLFLMRNLISRKRKH